MYIFAHNGIDHIDHTHKSAAHANEPNYLLIFTLLAVFIAVTVLLITQFTAKSQAKKVRADRKEKKEE